MKCKNMYIKHIYKNKTEIVNMGVPGFKKLEKKGTRA